MKENQITIREWFIHMWDWFISIFRTCPIFDPYPHTYISSIRSREQTCIICGCKNQLPLGEYMEDLKAYQEYTQKIKDGTDREGD